MRLLTVFTALVSLTLGLATQALAQASTIRDTEIENTIRNYNAPIFTAAGLDIHNVRIFLVNDQRLNAFVSGGQQIFLNTGLLMEAENAGQVIGVLAHETAHITGGHLSQFDENIRNAQSKSLAATLIGVPLALLTGRGDVFIASQALGSQIANRSFLQFTRTQEQAADQAAVQFLDGAGISAQGMLEFFEKLKKNEAIYTSSQNPYNRTHPLTSSRMNFVAHHIQTSRFSGNNLPPHFKQLHDRMRAKLIGYIKPDETLRYYPEDDLSVPSRYARSIAAMRKHRTDEALALVDSLIKESPEDPFFIELKGDILFKAARMEEAVEVYEQAIGILPWAALIRQTAARAYIEQGGEQNLDKAVAHLKEALRYEPESSFSWKQLGIANARLKNEAEAALAFAEEAIRRNKPQVAKFQARKAMELLPNGSPGWLRAQDIEFQANKGEQEAGDNEQGGETGRDGSGG